MRQNKQTRALNGVEVPVYSYGKLVGTRRTYNDRLLMFMLRNRAPDRFAEGRAKGMNALDQMQLEREKKRWRKEWEKEREAASTSPEQVRASIDRKIEGLRREADERRQREWESLSEETREAWERFERLKERDLSEQRLLESDDRRATSEPKGRPAAAPYGAKPSDADASRPAFEGENQRPLIVRSVKDDGWD